MAYWTPAICNYRMQERPDIKEFLINAQYSMGTCIVSHQHGHLPRLALTFRRLSEMFQC